MSEAQPIVPRAANAVAASSTDDLLRVAVERGSDIETLERLMALRERMQAEQARRDYYGAIAAFQADCPTVERTKKGGQGMYAPLEVIVATVRDVLQAHGLSYSFDTEHGADSVTVSCTVRHAGGHSERGTVVIPRYKGRGTNEAQDSGGAISYGRRYALCNALGIVTADADTDGAGLGDRRDGESITDEQAADLQALAEEVGITDPDVLLRGLSSVAGRALRAPTDLPARLYGQAVARLERRRSQS